MSKNDINTFSRYEKANDAGFAGKLSLDNKIPLSPHFKGGNDSVVGDSWNLLTNVNYEYEQKNFTAIERFRNVEFERDWNRGNTATTTDQNIIGGN